MTYQHGFFTRSTALVLIAALAAGLGLWVAQTRFAPKPAQTPPPAAAPKLQTVRLFPNMRELPDFTLNSAGGAHLDKAALAGRWTLVYLGFTRCADVCPTTLAEMSKAQKQWRSLPAATRPRLLFVSVDPDRDDPEHLAEYVRYFDPDTLSATAPEPALGAFAKSMGLVYMKVPTGNGDYEMDHSDNLMLLDPQVREAGLIRPPFAPEQIAADLNQLAKAGS
jgi:protein SCO1/2